MDQPDDRRVAGEAGRDEDRQHDREPGEPLGRGRAEEEGDAERNGCERVAEVVDQVRQQRNAAAGDVDGGLRRRGRPEDAEADRNCANARARAEDRRVHEAVRVPVAAPVVVVFVSVLQPRISRRSGL